MSMSAKLRRAPLRIATGAFILNSGVSKLSVDDDHAKTLHGMAVGTYPVVQRTEPKMFARALGIGEIAVGSALLLPIVPPFVAGAALVGFSGALLNLYWRTPGMHQEGNPRPTAQGVAIAKDTWMMGIGLGLMADAAFEPAHDKVVELERSVSERRAEKSRRARRKAKKAAAAAGTANAERLRKQTAARLAEMRDDYGSAAAERAKALREAARQAADEYGPVAAERAKALREAARHAADEYGPVATEKARAARDAAREFAGEYGPRAAEKARAAREAAREFAGDYAPAAADLAAAKARAARATAQEYAAKARMRAAG